MMLSKEEPPFWHLLKQIKIVMTSQEIDIAFKKAVESVNEHTEPFPADTLLKLYAYYKRATNSWHNSNNSKKKLISAWWVSRQIQTNLAK